MSSILITWNDERQVIMIVAPDLSDDDWDALLQAVRREVHFAEGPIDLDNWNHNERPE